MRKNEREIRACDGTPNSCAVPKIFPALHKNQTVVWTLLAIHRNSVGWVSAGAQEHVFRKHDCPFCFSSASGCTQKSHLLWGGACPQAHIPKATCVVLTAEFFYATNVNWIQTSYAFLAILMLNFNTSHILQNHCKDSQKVLLRVNAFIVPFQVLHTYEVCHPNNISVKVRASRTICKDRCEDQAKDRLANLHGHPTKQ